MSPARRRSKILQWFLLPMAPLMLASLAANASAEPTSLNGSWQLESGTIDGQAMDVVKTAVRLQINDGNFGGVGGCNQYGGTWDPNGANVHFGNFAMTERGCEDRRLELENHYVAALVRVRAAQRGDDSLRLTGEGVALNFSERPAVPLDELVDVDWDLTGLLKQDDDGRNAWSIDERKPPWLNFWSDGRVAGSTGCREFAGRYTVQSPYIRLDGLTWSGRCRENEDETDAHIATVITRPFRIDIYLESLELIGSEGLGITYRSEDRASGPGCRSTPMQPGLFALILVLGGLTRKTRRRPSAAD